VRLAGAHAALFAALAGGVAAAFWLALQAIEYADVDAALRADARDAVSNLADAGSSPDQPPLEAPGGAVALVGGAPGGIAVGVTILQPDGRVVASSGPVPAPADASGLARRLPARAGPRIVDLRSRSLHQRALVERVGGQPLVLVLSHPLTELDHDLATVAVLLSATVAGLVALAGGLGYWLTGRALRPVGTIAGLARDLSERYLHRRIDLPLPPDELGELGRTFNGMLERLERAFLSLRTFTADAAHELRAPLTLMRAELDAALGPGGRRLIDPGLGRSLVDDTERLGHLADQLLLLAQADAGRLAARRAPVDVADLVEERGDRWRAVASARGVDLVVSAPDSGSTRGDAELLERLLDNLLDNALRHTPRGGMVCVAAGAGENGGWEIHVADTGPGVASELRPRVFERFSRAAGSRSRESGGAGLGLAICAAVAEAHGGSIRLEDGDSGGAHFVVRLPRPEAPGHSPGWLERSPDS
jgi:two-component system heavy metal sensor histidine kinase CusS